MLAIREVPTATAPDRVQRAFTADAPDRLWVADITYLRTWEGFLYLAVVDAFSRRAVGWAMADHLRTEHVLDAVADGHRQAPPRRRDRAPLRPVEPSQYTSYEFGAALRSSGLLASTGRVGSAYDNALAETTFATLTTKLVYRRSWPTRPELEMEVFPYLEGFYNTRRRHSRLDNLSPAHHEARHLTRNQVSA